MAVRRRPQRGHRFTESPVLQLALQGWRSRSVGLLLMGAFLALVGRGFYLQVINNDFLQEKGDSRYRRDIEVSASRGKITDRNGDMLAVSTPMKSVWAIPGDARTMTQPQIYAAAIPVLGFVADAIATATGARPPQRHLFGTIGAFSILTFRAWTFLAFAHPDLKPQFHYIGVGLAVAVFLDATIIRGVLLPASMKLLGERNWYLPRWLEWLPRTSRERSPVRIPGQVAPDIAG